jgi:hypothetical protein
MDPEEIRAVCCKSVDWIHFASDMALVNTIMYNDSIKGEASPENLSSYSLFNKHSSPWNSYTQRNSTLLFLWSQINKLHHFQAGIVP